MRDIVYVRRVVDLLKTTNFKVNACMYIIYTVSHFSYAPLIKCKITGKRNMIFLILRLSVQSAYIFALVIGIALCSNQKQMRK